MGYACPVCATPQQDAEHLANHLAFTAMLGHDDHEAWLDEHAPGWGDGGPEDLAERLAGHDAVEREEFPQVFEDTTGGGSHGHEHAHDHASAPPDRPAPGESFEDAVARATGDRAGRDATDDVLARARELTREMLDDDENETE